MSDNNSVSNQPPNADKLAQQVKEKNEIIDHLRVRALHLSMAIKSKKCSEDGYGVSKECMKFAFGEDPVLAKVLKRPAPDNLKLAEKTKKPGSVIGQPLKIRSNALPQSRQSKKNTISEMPNPTEKNVTSSKLQPRNSVKTQLDLNALKHKYETALQENRELKKRNAEMVEVAEKHNKTVEWLKKRNVEMVEEHGKMIKELNKQGLDKCSENQYTEALILFIKLIGAEGAERNSSRWLGELWNNTSLCWSGMKKFKKALEASDKAIEYDDSRSTFFYNRGIHFRDLGKSGEAEADFKKATDLDSKRELENLEKSH